VYKRQAVGAGQPKQVVPPVPQPRKYDGEHGCRCEPRDAGG